MTKIQQVSKQARTLFYSHFDGVLSTHSVDLPDYPFGSIVPYCLDYQGRPLILISTIAQHTRNISNNNKVSLISFDNHAADKQAAGRVTYIGNAVPVENEETAERYYRYFPSSRNFHKTHDFHFYAIEFVKARFIGGFGQINWLDKEDFLLTNPFTAEQEAQIVNHMNQDHLEALTHYCDLFEISSSEQATLAGIDREGFDLRCGHELHRITFDKEVNDTTEARQALVELARR